MSSNCKQKTQKSANNTIYMLNSLTADKAVKKIQSQPRARLTLFREIDPPMQGNVLLKLPSKTQKDITQKLTDDEIIALLNFPDPDKVTDILQLLEIKRSEKITQKLNNNTREKVEFLLRFNPKAAAGLMNLNYLVIEQTDSLKKITERVIEHEKRNGKFPTILVTENSNLIGELPGHVLVTHKGSHLLDSPNLIKKVPVISYDTDEHKVVNSFIKHPHDKVVVLDDNQSILGIIHSDDILRLVDKHSMKDLYGFAGVDTEEGILDSAMTKVKYRYKWLIINLGTAFLAASVVGLFENTISRFTLLAVYMPIVAGMGGNAGTQTLAVAIRGLVLKEVELKTSRALIINEMQAGAVNGLINGLIVAAVAIIFNQSPALGLVIGVAMITNLVVAGFFGALVPMIMKSIGKDPASSATIFITTATDVIGFFVFLGLASIVLR